MAGRAETEYADWSGPAVAGAPHSVVLGGHGRPPGTRGGGTCTRASKAFDQTR